MKYQLYTLIIEPHEDLLHPYSYLDESYLTHRVVSIENGMRSMTHKHPDLVMLSSSFSIAKALPLLDTLKHISQSALIPLLYVVDLTCHVSQIPGTTWGNKLGIVSTLSNSDEMHSTLDRILSS